MGHRIKIDVAVDGEDQLAIRAKLGFMDLLIAQVLRDAVKRFSEHWQGVDERRDAALMFLDCVSSTAEDGVGLYKDFGRDPTMDAHAFINISSADGSITIQYESDESPSFSGMFEEFLVEHGLDD